LIGQNVSEGRLTAPYYWNFLLNELPLRLEDVHLAKRRLQHEEARPHFGRAMTEYFNEGYEGRLIGKGGPVAWPA
jgi:hypothetical protein